MFSSIRQRLRLSAVRRRISATGNSPYETGTLKQARLPEPFSSILEARQPVLPAYEYLARFWHEHAAPFAINYVPYVDHFAGEFSLHVEAAADLACGTGLTTLPLVARFLRVYAIDKSEAMLARARQALSGKSAVCVQTGDLTDFRLPEPVQVLTCGGDSINYLCSAGSLRAAFESALAALSVGGLFAFDVVTERMMRFLSGTAIHIEVTTRDGAAPTYEESAGTVLRT